MLLVVLMKLLLWLVVMDGIDSIDGISDIR